MATDFPDALAIVGLAGWGAQGSLPDDGEVRHRPSFNLSQFNQPQLLSLAWPYRSLKNVWANLPPVSHSTQPLDHGTVAPTLSGRPNLWSQTSFHHRVGGASTIKYGESNTEWRSTCPVPHTPDFTSSDTAESSWMERQNCMLRSDSGIIGSALNTSLLNTDIVLA